MKDSFFNLKNIQTQQEKKKKDIVIKIDDAQKPTKLPGLNKILWRKKM